MKIPLILKIIISLFTLFYISNTNAVWYIKWTAKDDVTWQTLTYVCYDAPWKWDYYSCAIKWIKNTLPWDVLCPTNIDPVCWQPPMPTCQTWIVCSQVMPQPKTYSNSCEMKKAWATLLYKWTCSNSNTTNSCSWTYHSVVWPVWDVSPNPDTTMCNSSNNWKISYEIWWNKQKVATCTCNWIQTTNQCPKINCDVWYNVVNKWVNQTTWCQIQECVKNETTNNSCNWIWHDIVWPVWEVYPNPYTTNCTNSINWTSSFEVSWSKRKVFTCLCEWSSNNINSWTTKNNNFKLYNWNSKPVSWNISTYWTQNWSICNNQNWYSIITWLDKNNPPKWCTNPANNDNCKNNLSNFRDYNPSEWLNNSTIVTSSSSDLLKNYPLWTYNFYLAYWTQIIKVWEWTLKSCTTNYSWSCIVPWPVEVNTSWYTCNSSTVWQSRTISWYSCTCTQNTNTNTNTNSTTNNTTTNSTTNTCKWQAHDVVWPIWQVSPNPNSTLCTIGNNWTIAYEIWWNRQKVATCTCPNSASTSTSIPSPIITLSKTLNWATTTNFYSRETMYWKVINSWINSTYSCVAPTTDLKNPDWSIIASSKSCNDRSKWAKMPNSDWKYDSSSNSWRMSRSWVWFPSSTYRLWFRDNNTNKESSIIINLKNND